MPLKLVLSNLSDIYCLKCSAVRYAREIRSLNMYLETHAQDRLNHLIYMEELMTRKEESTRRRIENDKLYAEFMLALNSSISDLH